jgi:hypothetical protein
MQLSIINKAGNAYSYHWALKGWDKNEEIGDL